MSKLISKARAGVTLVELLVVILIVTILSVSLLPLLKPYIVKAQYAAEPIPVLGNIRTQIGMFQYEKDYLPGLKRDSKGVVQCQESDMSSVLGSDLGGKGGDSRLDAATSALQTFVGDTDKSTGLTSYHNAIWSTDLKTICSTGEVETVAGSDDGAGNTTPAIKFDPDVMKNHFAEDIRVDYADFTGKRMRPQHLQYRAIYGGYKTGAYAYIVGCFGDATGLAAGTGYAMIEIVNPKFKVKYVGTWERYKKVSDEADQIMIKDNTEARADGVTSADLAKEANLCWIGDPSKYLSSTDGDESVVNQAIEDLKKAGWEF